MTIDKNNYRLFADELQWTVSRQYKASQENEGFYSEFGNAFRFFIESLLRNLFTTSANLSAASLKVDDLTKFVEKLNQEFFAG